MKHGIISIICLLFLVNVLGGDELSDKQKQLDKVQKDLQKAQQKIEQNEAKKKKNETEISNTRRAKQKSDVELRRTQEIAREKLQSLNVVKTELRSVEEQIGDLKAMQNTQLIKMVRVSRRNGKIGFIHKDQHCLALLAGQTRQKLNDLGDIQQELAVEQSEKGQEFSQADSEFKAKASTSQTLGKKVQNLEYQQSQLTKEQ